MGKTNRIVVYPTGAYSLIVVCSNALSQSVTFPIISQSVLLLEQRMLSYDVVLLNSCRTAGESPWISVWEWVICLELVLYILRSVMCDQVVITVLSVG